MAQMGKPNKAALFHFQPFSPKQKKILTWWMPQSPYRDYNGVIADGSIRSGKTLSMSLAFALWAMTSYHDQAFALCGKTIGALRRNVIQSLKLMLQARGFAVRDRRADNVLIVRYGDRENIFYLFGGTDERSQDLVQGVTLAGVLFDEVALMPRSFVEQALGRCSVTGSKYWFNCNPGPPTHWFYLDWIKGAERHKVLYLHFRMEDNLSLSEEVRQRYLAMYTGVFYRRYILGLWVRAEGLVYPMFDRDRHVVRGPLPEPSRNARYYVAIDYGTVNPFAAGLYMYDPDTRTATMIRELYFSGGTEKRVDNEAYYAMLKSLIGDTRIEHIVIDPSAASMIETIQKYGEYIVLRARNDVIDGIQDVTKFLNAGALKFHESCTHTFEEFESYSWNEKSPTDSVIKENDHSMDQLRYFCRSILRAELAWLV